MARATKLVNQTREADFQWMWQRLQEAGFIVLVAVSLFIAVALLTFHSADPGWSRFSSAAHIQNAGGQAGAWLADVAYALFGVFAYLFPGLLLYSGIKLLYRKTDDRDLEPLLWCFRSMGFVCCLVAGSCLAQQYWAPMEPPLPMGSGGILGQLVQEQALRYLGVWGSLVGMLALFLVGVTLATGLSWFGLVDVLKKKSRFCWLEAQQRLASLNALSLRNVAPKQSKPRVERPKRLPVADIFLPELPQERAMATAPALEPALEEPLRKPNGTAPTSNTPGSPSVQTKQLPSVSLLQEAPHFTERAQTLSDAQLQALSRDVEERLLEFGIQAQVVAAFPGPVITRFELEPAAGVKVSRIVALAKDLARALLVSRVRVVEVIPGKSVIGLEIPNPERELVSLRSVLESELYQSAAAPLTLALGKDISGEPVVVNLAKMPHLLVAGTTGSGKSVGVNAMLLSLLYKATPDVLRLILIDPKMLELSIYEGIPHLLTPVVTDMKDAAQALRWCVSEMERRYQQMAGLGVRHLEGFNQKIDEAARAGEVLYDVLTLKAGDPKPLEKLPYIVVIVDEFADMMMVVGKKVEELIARIAQKARAAGIHLILATQRPSVDVITGLIKANIPSRMAFQVASRIDSRTILDQQGAEQLLGYGDMLYLPPGSGIPVRVHGAFVSDEEVHAVVGELKRYGAPDYLPDLLDSGSLMGQTTDAEGEADELYDEAVKIVVESRRASISHLQRRLKIGYNRAARLVEAMEAAGLVSALQSGGNREVMVAE